MYAKIVWNTLGPAARSATWLPVLHLDWVGLDKSQWICISHGSQPDPTRPDSNNYLITISPLSLFI